MTLQRSHTNLEEVPISTILCLKINPSMIRSQGHFIWMNFYNGNDRNLKFLYEIDSFFSQEGSVLIEHILPLES